MRKPCFASMRRHKIRLRPFGVEIGAHLKAAPFADDGVWVFRDLPDFYIVRAAVREDQQVAVSYRRPRDS